MSALDESSPLRSLLSPSPDTTSGVSSGAPTIVSTTITTASTSASAAPPDFFMKRLALPLHLPALPRPCPHSAKRITDDPRLRFLAPPRLQLRPRSARGPPRADIPRLTAHLFNSGLDANAGFFPCVQQPGDATLRRSHPRFGPRRSAGVARRTAAK